MVRCSRIPVVQLLVCFAVVGLLTNYLTQDSVNSNNINEEVSYRTKFQRIVLEAASQQDLQVVKQRVRTVPEQDLVVVTQRVRTVPVTGYTSPVNSTSTSQESGRSNGVEGVGEGELGIERVQQEQSELQYTELEQSEQYTELEQPEQEQLEQEQLEQEQLEQEQLVQEQLEQSEQYTELEQPEQEQLVQSEQQHTELEQPEQAQLEQAQLEQPEQEQLEQEQLEQEQVDEQEQEQERATSSEELESAAEQRILQRMERIKRACGRLGNPNSSQYNMYHFSGLGPHGITWCPTFKASSSTWRDFFIDTVMGPDANFKGTHYHLAVLGNSILSRGKVKLRGSSPDRRRRFEGEGDESIRFTVVRHPMSRLISHLLKAQNYPYEVRAQQGAWVEESIMLGRTDPAWDAATKHKYKSEWNVYLNEIESEAPHDPFSEDNPYLHPPYPSFLEMINFIMKHRRLVVDNKGANGHWRPAIEWCDVCQNNFNIIIQLEEEPGELVYLLKKLDMLEYKDTFLSRHNTSGKKSASEQEIRDYVKLLNSDQIDFLNRMYARDFEVLGYNPIVYNS